MMRSRLAACRIGRTVTFPIGTVAVNEVQGFDVIIHHPSIQVEPTIGADLNTNNEEDA